MGGKREEVVIAVDPGRMKCGVAVIDSGSTVSRQIVSRGILSSCLRGLILQHDADVLVIGDRTGSSELRQELVKTGVEDLVKVVTVDEHLSSQEGRHRYLRDHPASGWRKLLPASMRYPDEPYDHYVAEVLAERYLKGG